MGPNLESGAERLALCWGRYKGWVQGNSRLCNFKYWLAIWGQGASK